MTLRLPNRALQHATAAIAAVVVSCLCAPAGAQGAYGGAYRPPVATTDPIPELQDVTILDKPNSQLPLDATLVTDDGRTVTLRDVLPKDRPAILQLGYMRCPQLCSLVMNALVRGMQGVDWTVGKEFDVISISINPDEKPELAAGKKAGYVAEYGRTSGGAGAAGWHFMTGDDANIHRVADAVGFQYKRRPDGEYSHAAAVFLITPDGRLSRTLYGVRYEPETLRMGLLEASEGRIGTAMDRFILWCHVYDPNSGGYVLMAMHIMQLGGLLTIALMGGTLGYLWWREASRRKLAAPLSATHA
ncbi:MAG: SCO family protein [Phycisphaerales bacterium]